MVIFLLLPVLSCNIHEIIFKAYETMNCLSDPNVTLQESQPF